MELKEVEEKLLTLYLLGDLSADEKAQIEDRFFADDEYYQSLLIAEDELIYSYLHGRLSGRESALFAAQIAASPKRREKVQLVKALMAEATQAAATARATSVVVTTLAEGASWWQTWLAFLTGRNAALQFAMAAGLLLLGVAGSWLWTQTRHLNAELQLAQARYEQSALDAAQREQNAKQHTNDLQKEKTDLAETLKQEQAARAQLAKEKEQLENQLENAAAQTGLIIPFTLEQGILRSQSEDPKPISIPRRASRIELTLDLGSDDGNGKYRAEFNTRGGTLIWSQDGLSAQQRAFGKAVVLNLPASVFRNSEYDLTLKRALGKGHFEDVGYYYFKVVKR